MYLNVQSLKRQVEAIDRVATILETRIGPQLKQLSAERCDLFWCIGHLQGIARTLKEDIGQLEEQGFPPPPEETLMVRCSHCDQAVPSDDVNAYGECPTCDEYLGKLEDHHHG